jgi:hypothetical protein
MHNLSTEINITAKANAQKVIVSPPYHMGRDIKHFYIVPLNSIVQSGCLPKLA